MIKSGVLRSSELPGRNRAVKNLVESSTVEGVTVNRETYTGCQLRLLVDLGGVDG